MSIISNLMALLEEERLCIEQTGCLCGHTKQDPGVYYAPHNPWADVDREYHIKWEDVQIGVEQVATAQKIVDEYLLSAMSSTEYLNNILAMHYSKSVEDEWKKYYQ